MVAYPKGGIVPQILHQRLPVALWMAAHTLRLPGTVPIALEDWLQRDEVFGPQMALRDRLIAACEAVLRVASNRR